MHACCRPVKPAIFSLAPLPVAPPWMSKKAYTPPFAELMFWELLHLNANTFQIFLEEFTQAFLDLSSLILLANVVEWGALAVKH
jgi:hypothetical protein